METSKGIGWDGGLKVTKGLIRISRVRYGDDTVKGVILLCKTFTE